MPALLIALIVILAFALCGFAYGVYMDIVRPMARATQRSREASARRAKRIARERAAAIDAHNARAAYRSARDKTAYPFHA